MAVRTAMGCQIGALPRTPFPASRDFPSRGNEKYGEEKQRVIYFTYHFAVSPFGGERSEPIRSMRIMPYDTESQSRNADFISIAAERQSTTLGLKGRQTYEPSGQRPVNLKNLFPQPFYTTCGGAAPLFYNLRRSRHHHPRPERPSNLRTLRTFGTKSRQPSHRRCVPCSLFYA